MHSYASGFTLGLSLILAIGAQNAFVLKQGLKKQHVFLVCSICAASDAFLIFLGVSGFGVIVEQYPSIEKISRYAGAIFLVVYGLKSFYSAYHNSHALNPEGATPISKTKIALMCLAFTWLNPHVYLDTVVLLGSVSTQFEDTRAFGIGAITSSFVFFFSLGYSARILIPIFQKPIAWKILEAFVGVLMLGLAVSLLV
jgi:L-lysine exporter family protein LysE/ArgO